MLGKLFHIITFLTIAVTLLLLYFANFKREKRYQQLSYPLLALGLAIITIGFYNELYGTFKKHVINFSSTISTINDNLFIDNISQYFDIFFILCVTILFVIIKYIAKFFLLRFQKSHLLAYSYCDDAFLILLKDKWVFVKIFVKYSILLASILALISFIELKYSWGYFPLFTSVSTLVLLEIFWYLNGITKNHFSQDKIIGQDSTSNLNVTYEKLWKNYQEVWPNQLLTGWYFLKNSEKNDLLEQFNDPVLDILSRKGLKFSSKEVRIYNSIKQREDVLIESSRYSNISPILFAAIYNSISKGENILFITNSKNNSDNNPFNKEISNWIYNNLFHITGLKYFAQPYCYTPSNVEGIKSNILIASAGDIVSNGIIEEKWFSNLTTTVFMNVANMFEGEISLNNILLNIIKHRNPNLQIISLSDTYRTGIEASVRSIIPVNNKLSEVRYNDTNPNRNYILIWKSDYSDTFQSKVLKGAIGKHLGEETVLALLARKMGISNIRLLGVNNLPNIEFIEEIEKHKQTLIDGLNFKEIESKYINIESMPFLKQSTENGVSFCRDNKFNLPVAIRKWNSFIEDISLLSVVSPPYILRDYFIGNIKYFYNAPIYSLAPTISKTKFSLAYFIIWLLIKNKTSENQLKKILSRYNIAKEHTKTIEILKFQIQKTLNICNLDDYLTISREDTFDQDSEKFVSELFYRLNKTLLDDTNLYYLKRINIQDDSGNTLRKVQYDFLHQQFLENQIHSFYGKPYRIGYFDKESLTLNVNFVSPARINRYSQSRKVILKDIPTPTYHNILQETKIREKYTLQLFETEFKVKTTGYFEFQSSIDLNKEPIFHELRKYIVRQYPHGKMLKIQFFKPNIDNLDFEKIISTLCTIINEIFYTLFPETYNYILCGSPSVNKFYKGIFNNYFPLFTLENDKQYADNKNTFSLYFIEDAHQDLGLLPTFFNQFNHILEIIDDYLYWLNDDKDSTLNKNDKPEGEHFESKINTDNKEINKKTLGQSVNSKPINELFNPHNNSKDDFLKFGFDNLPDFISPIDTKKFLEQIQINKQNNITKQRYDFYEGKNIFLISGETGHYCDFCAAQIMGAEIEVLNDGRERCTLCKQTSINNLKELKEILEESKKYFTSLFNTKLPKGITIEFTSSEHIQNMQGEKFIPTSDFDARTIGLAWDKNIMIENGAPYSRTLSTVVHELTHIWQNANLNKNMMSEETKLLLIEGHAVWASIKVLENKNIALEYRNHYSLRNDEYGKGLKKIQNLLNKKGSDNAFNVLKGIYPI